MLISRIWRRKPCLNFNFHVLGAIVHQEDDNRKMPSAFLGGRQWFEWWLLKKDMQETQDAGKRGPDWAIQALPLWRKRTAVTWCAVGSTATSPSFQCHRRRVVAADASDDERWFATHDVPSDNNLHITAIVSKYAGAFFWSFVYYLEDLNSHWVSVIASSSLAVVISTIEMHWRRVSQGE